MERTTIAIPQPLQDHLRGLEGIEIIVASIYAGDDGFTELAFPFQGGRIRVTAEGGGNIKFEQNAILLEHCPRLWLRSVVVSLVETNETVDVILPRESEEVSASTDEAVYKVWASSSAPEDEVVKFRGGRLFSYKSELFALVTPRAE